MTNPVIPATEMHTRRNSKAAAIVEAAIETCERGISFTNRDVCEAIRKKGFILSDSAVTKGLRDAAEKAKVLSISRGRWVRPIPMAQAVVPPTPMLPEEAQETTSLVDVKRAMDARFDELKALILGLKARKEA